MSATTFANLRELREKLAGFRPDSAARLAGLEVDRLQAIEEGEAPSVYELEVLSDLYGVPAHVLADEPIRLDPNDAIQVLMSLAEFVEISDVARARIVAAATAARDARRMEGLNGPIPRQPAILDREVPGLRLPPHRRGAEFAAHVRTKLGLGNKPIGSVRDLVSSAFPSVLLLYADLTPEGPAGVTFSDPLRGSTIVLNLKGQNINPAMRRFSLAHELCHVLLDAHHVRHLAVVSGYLPEHALARERVANAFAVRLLCPETQLRKIQKANSTEVTLYKLLHEYGLHYGAARLYLRNETDAPPLPPSPSPSMTALSMDPELARAEEPVGVASFPIQDVPPERRTAVAMHAARAYATGKIPRDELADLLRVPPSADLESVLDLFGFSRPSSTETQVA